MKVMPFDIGMLRNAKLCCCVSQILPKGDVVTDDEHALACSEQLRGTRRQHNRLSTSRGPLYSTITAGRPRCCQLTLTRIQRRNSSLLSRHFRFKQPMLKFLRNRG